MSDLRENTLKPLWEVTPKKVKEAVQKIIDISNPRKIILFGSYISKNININSDLDVLVVTGDNIGNPRKESVRIRRALKNIYMPMDILVVPESQLDILANTPGLIYREVLSKGKVVYESNR